MSETENAPNAAEPRLLHATVSPEGWPQPKGYANAVMTDGGIIYTGGLVGWDREGRFPEGSSPRRTRPFATSATCSKRRALGRNI
nr:hypothetical protein [Nitratireductor aquibiodomus]